MTKAQIKSALAKKPPTDIDHEIWTTMEGSYSFVCLVNDQNINKYPTCIQFCFNHDDEVMYLRRTDGRPISISDTEYTTDFNKEYAYFKRKEKGKDAYYKIRFVHGGVYNDGIGIFHDAISYNNISGFFTWEAEK